MQKPQKQHLLRAATVKHTNQTRLAMTGKGVDRHLFALYVLSKGFGYASDFLAYVFDQKWTLSTSQAPTITDRVDENKNVDLSWLGPSFGPVDPLGYGLCYYFNGDHSIALHISARKSAKVSVSAFLTYHSAPIRMPTHCATNC